MSTVEEETSTCQLGSLAEDTTYSHDRYKRRRFSLKAEVVTGQHFKYPVLIVCGYSWSYRIAKFREQIGNKIPISECCCTEIVSAG
jgi:hypothetical protein